MIHIVTAVFDIEMLLGMCMVAPGCNVSEQITCHRHKPMLHSPWLVCLPSGTLTYSNIR